ncbi:recombinase family protein [Streptomyces sp. NPDC056479]|uniref:recombinase family protein n=1 Tax=unclassified Streptomyces TaxID=2593676 RepID=UPI00369BC787
MGKGTVMRGRRSAGVVRVAIYLRVSTMQQLEGYGLKVQEDQCRAWLAYALRGQEHVVVDVYVDGGVSGKLAKRDDLDRLTADIMGGKLDLVVFGKLDRIGRTMKNIHRWVYDVTDYGVRVATADGRIDSDDEMFGIQLSLLAYMAEVEHALILERTMGGRMQKAAAGGWPLGEPPFGIMLDADGNPVLNPDEVRQIEAYADFMIDSPEPVTQEDGARHLNALGYTQRNGRPWVGGNLGRRIEASLRGYVEFVFAGENEDGDPITTTFRIDVPKPLPDDRVEQLRAAINRGKRIKGKHSRYLLSNRLISSCGAHRTGGSTATGRYYRCMGGRVGRGTPGSHEDCWELPVEDVDAAVWSEIDGLLEDKTKLHGLIAKWLGTVPERAASYRRRLAELDEQLEKKRSSRKSKIALLLASAEDDDHDVALIEELKAELRQQEQELLQERSRVADWLADAEAQEERARELLHAVDSIDTSAENFTLEQKLDLLELLDVQVQIMDKGVPRHKGLVDPITEWHRENDVPVPAQLTDEMWDKAKDLLSGTRQWKDVRGAFDVMLEKLRTGKPWNEYSGCERIGGRAYASLYRRVHHWFDSEEYQAVLKALRAYPAVRVPPSYVLPRMLVMGAVAPKFTAAQVATEHDHVCDGSGVGEAGGTPSCNLAWRGEQASSADRCRSATAPAPPTTRTS